MKMSNNKLFDKGFEEGHGGHYGDIHFDFDGTGGQTFATVTFQRRNEDDEACEITVIQKGLITKQVVGDNKYNPSNRRSATCVYLLEDAGDEGDMKRIEIIEHKGLIGVGFADVDKDEYKYLFGKRPKKAKSDAANFGEGDLTK